MALIKCKMCGGDLVLQTGSAIAECEYCGTVQTVPAADNEKKLTLFNRANRLRYGCEFDKAAGVYEAIVADFPEEPEAYWGLVLCKYGIEYVDDPATGKKIPTCHRSSFESVMENDNFQQVLENSDVTARKLYREEAKQIEELRKGIIEVSAKEEPYDIFICYKETAENGDRTLDSVLAQDIYDALTDKGYRVFFARITLEDKLGQAYEPYIFAALNSAKIMLAVGTDFEYYNAVWVKNEWSRFLKLMEKDKSKYLIPCFKGLDAYDMPREFTHLQAQDLGKVGATQDLLRGIRKLLPDVHQRNTDILQQRNVETFGMVMRGKQAMIKGEFSKARAYFECALDQDPFDDEAQIGKVLSVLKVRDLKEFEESKILTDGSGAVEQILQSVDGKAKDVLLGALERKKNEIRKRILEKKKAEYDRTRVKFNVSGSEYSEGTILVRAVLKGDVKEVQQLLECGASIEDVRHHHNSNGVSTIGLLHDSVSKSSQITKLLLEKGADVDFISEMIQYGGEIIRCPPLLKAVKCGNRECVRLLLERGADINTLGIVRSFGGDSCYSALQVGIQTKDVELVRLLLDRGADANYVYKGLEGAGYTERTMLAEAVMTGKMELVGLLLEHGADPRKERIYRDDHGDSRYSLLGDVLRASDDPALIRSLIEHGADPAGKDRFYDESGNCHELPMLILAVQKTDREIVTLLLEKGADPNIQSVVQGYNVMRTNALWECVRHTRNTEMLALLLEQGTDVRFRNELVLYFLGEKSSWLDDENYPIYDGDRQERTALCEAVIQGKRDMVRMLLENGADPNDTHSIFVESCWSDAEQDTCYRSVLSDSIGYARDPAIMQELIEKGADIFYEDTSVQIEKDGGKKNTKTSLFVCAVCTGDPALVEMLMRYGGTMNTEVAYANRRIPLKKYPFQLSGQMLETMKRLGWKGPGLFDRF